MKKDIMDIKLVNGLIISECESNSDADVGVLDNMTEGIIVVDARGLMVSLSYETSFVAIKKAREFSFCLKNPFRSDNIGIG